MKSLDNWPLPIAMGDICPTDSTSCLVLSPVTTSLKPDTDTVSSTGLNWRGMEQDSVLSEAGMHVLCDTCHITMSVCVDSRALQATLCQIPFGMGLQPTLRQIPVGSIAGRCGRESYSHRFASMALNGCEC